MNELETKISESLDLLSLIEINSNLEKWFFNELEKSKNEVKELVSLNHFIDIAIDRIGSKINGLNTFNILLLKRCFESFTDTKKYYDWFIALKQS